MPSVTQPELPSLCSSKKRRWDDVGEVQMPLLDQTSIDALPSNDMNRMVFDNSQTSRRQLPSFTEALQRKIRPLSTTKRIRVSEDSDDKEGSRVKDEYQQTTHPHSNYSTPPISPQIRPQDTSRTVSSVSLSPCHICHRKPTKKTELDSFADCEGCGQRTCYVCIRQCQGWLADSGAMVHLPHETVRKEGEDDDHTAAAADKAMSRSFTMHDADDEEQWISGHNDGSNITAIKGATNSTGPLGWNSRGHGSVICSRCCVERGSEGDVMCLGCLAGVEAA